MKKIWKQIRPAFMALIVFTVICGIIYTGIITGIAGLVFPYQANGSIITVTLKDGTQKDYGSELIAQEFTEPQYLIGRPMEISNLSPTSKEQQKRVNERINWWHNFDPDNKGDIPLDLVTASGSGVDPYISPEAAEYQVPRIARERHISEGQVRKIIDEYTKKSFLGFIGEPGVNVLQVNLALDGLI